MVSASRAVQAFPWTLCRFCFTREVRRSTFGYIRHYIDEKTIACCGKRQDRASSARCFTKRINSSTPYGDVVGSEHGSYELRIVEPSSPRRLLLY